MDQNIRMAPLGGFCIGAVVFVFTYSYAASHYHSQYWAERKQLNYRIELAKQSDQEITAEDKSAENWHNFIGPWEPMLYGFGSALATGAASYRAATAPLLTVHEPAVYYCCATAAGIVGLNLVLEDKPEKIQRQVLGGTMAVVGLQSFLPTALTSAWNRRRSSIIDVLTAVGGSCIFAGGLSLMWPPTKFGRKLFGYSLIALSAFYVAPQSVRNSVSL